MSSSPTDAAATIVAVSMPQMGVSVAEGTIVEWRKAPGDRVEADETICEVSTDKVDTEIPSPASGRVVRILVEAGKTVAVGTVLAEIDTADGAEGGVQRSEVRAEGAGVGDRDRGQAPRVAAEGANGAPDRSRVYSPVVQRIAAEHGIDLSGVKGSGVGGRVRKKDLLALIEAPEGHERPLHIESPYRGEEVAGERPAGGGRRELMSVMRQRIAEHMLRSRRTSAHVTTVAEVDMARVAQRRASLKAGYAERGVPLTYLAFVARAAVAALQEHPVLNASIEDDEIVYHLDVNLGIAVALDDGLIVPVIRRAQRLSLEGLAAAIADLSARAREKRLDPDDVQGGTFTITNPGQFGTVLATPIINQPQVAILDLEAVTKRPAVVEGPDGDSIGIRPATNLCLSFDHRALDGTEAARFLGRVKARLEGWGSDD